MIAGVVWLIAGFNVARLGVLSYLVIERQWFMYLLSVVVFVAFGMMFLKMSGKHTRRILGYEDRRPFWHFFDLKAYIIMACMMGGGIGLREQEYSPMSLWDFSIPDLAVRWRRQEYLLSQIS